ncbi:hypothetical protein RIF29_09345 [Crotalaria pallida]|uniref:Uncharacterized protein n=1 Tax=Crotalaria pallida TaxID=3830 RepID=A0AAN9FUL2_CROPI
MCLDDKRRGGGDDGDLCLTVLDGELDGDAKALPVLGGFFGDVFYDLLGREDRSSGRGNSPCADLTAGDPDVNVDDLGGVELWWHC